MSNTPKLLYLSVEGTKILVNKIKENTSAISSEATTTRAALVGKADKTYVDTELGKKANSSDVTSKLNEKIASSEKGKANGVATLGQDGLIPSSQLPSYVDDVIEGYYYNNNFYKDFNSVGVIDTPAVVGQNQLVYQDNSSADKSKYQITFNNVITPESGKIYVCKPLDNNNITILKGNNYNNDSICYRYTGSGYVPISDVPEDVITNIESLSNQIRSLQHNARNLVYISWYSLKELRDNGKLVAGTQYRITDYQCTTVQEDTQSAGHQFDIIVTADSNNKLNEVARAIQRDGDTYFSKSKLEAWKIWYRLDNDTTHFAWADATNGKGVIYRMIDEWNNDCPYDFKNIQFKRYKITKANSSDLVGTYLGLKKNNAKSIEIDANDNIWCYTFTAQVAVKTGDDFVIPNNAPYIDGSLESPYRHMSDEESSTYHDNKIGSYLITYNEDKVPTLCGKYYLPNNVFIGYFESTTNAADNDYCYAYCSYNITLDNNCYNNSFGTNCYSNSFGNDCHSNSFGNTCYRNSFGDSCNYNSFGNNCSFNSFGNICNYNSFGNSCNYNSFGNICNYNSFGDSCSFNSFGNSCHYNSFGNNCSENSFGNDCSSNSFGNGCHRNSFGNDCQYNSFGNNCSENSFGNSCHYNSFGNTCYRNSFGNDCYSNSFGDNCNYNSFGNSCHYNSFGNTCYRNSFGNNYYSNSFGIDCQYNSFGNNCHYNSFGNECYGNKLGVNSSNNKLDAYYENNKFENGVEYVEFSGVGTEAAKVQNYHIKQGMTFTSNAKHTITAKTGLNYELTVAKQSDGTVVEYCEADLLKALIPSDIVEYTAADVEALFA